MVVVARSPCRPQDDSDETLPGPQGEDGDATPRALEEYSDATQDPQGDNGKVCHALCPLCRRSRENRGREQNTQGDPFMPRPIYARTAPSAHKRYVPLFRLPLSHRTRKRANETRRTAPPFCTRTGAGTTPLFRHPLLPESPLCIEPLLMCERDAQDDPLRPPPFAHEKMGRANGTCRAAPPPFSPGPCRSGE